MTPDGPVIPFENLPPGFAESVESPPAAPASPRPAATIVLLRDGSAGLEVLLLRRTRESGFVPGAWVFPGGRVDRADAARELVGRVDGLVPEDAERRLALEGADPPGIAYYLAVVREAFEETGLLLARSGGADDGDPADAPAPGRAPAPVRPPAPAPARTQAAVPDAAEWTRGGAGDDDALRGRNDLLEKRAGFGEVLERMRCRIAGDAIEYVAHWITPEAEPRRYDTRFFAARVAAGREVSLDRREMTEALWIPPAEALARNREGGLPMVFPTLRTLEDFAAFPAAADALAHFRGREIPPILPRLVRTPTGIGIEMP